MSKISYGLDGKVVVVTGGSRGIGFEIARMALADGAKVVVTARKQDGLDAAANVLQAGDNLLTVPGHVAKEEDVDRLFASTREKFGRVDVLVNNVGMNLMTASVVETAPGAWRKIIDTNLTGTFLCSRKGAEIMKEQKAGKIVNVSSIAGHRAAPGMSIYGIAKAGIEMLTKVLAMELAAFNIQVNAVAPGMVKTAFSQIFWSNDELQREIVKSIPAGRLAEAIEVAHPVLFLCSQGADYITGHTLFVDGGAMAV
jgi:2-deoxy-D-gluconate 3-dehydrogenase